MKNKTKPGLRAMLMWAALIAVLTAVPSVVALGAGGVELKSKAELETIVKKPDGTKEVKLVDITKARVVPGDTVVFTISYVNKGDKPAKGVVIKNPVPKYMSYIGDSAEGKGTKIVFSVDNEKNYGEPGALKVKGADGKDRAAAPSDYTNVKWTLNGALAPGGKGSVSFKAKVK